MTIESTTFRTTWLAADGVNDEWPYAFTIYAEDTIVVYVRDSDGEITEHTDNFVWLRTNDTSGHVQFPSAGSPVVSGSDVRIERRVPYQQKTAIGNQGAFYPVVHERAFDNLSMQIQQVNDKADRSIKLAVDDIRDPTDIVDDIFDAKDESLAAAVSTAADAAATAADRVQTGIDAAASSASASAAAGSASAASGSATSAAGSASTATTQATAAAGSATAAAADAVQTAADRVQTGLDAIATAADRVQTGQDVVTTTTARDVAIAAADAAVTTVGYHATRNVTSLLADTSIEYGAVLPQVVAGDIIHTRMQGFAYEVAPADALDHHVATAGGVKLYVLPGQSGKHYAEAWGVTGDGTGSHNATIQKIIDSFDGALTVVLPAGITRVTGTVRLKRSRVGIEGAGPGGQSFYQYVNAGGGRVFSGDFSDSVSMDTYTGNFLRDFEVLSSGVEGNDADTIVELTSFSYGFFDIRAQSKRPNGIIYYGQGNNGASPYYNQIRSTGLFGWIDQTQRAFVFEPGLWTGGTPGPNSNFIGPITEAVLFKNFADLKAAQANFFTNIGIESIKDAYIIFGGRAELTSGFSSGSNTLATLNDTTKSWATNVYAGGTVSIISGTGAGQRRKIVSNSATQIDLLDRWGVTPDNTSTYTVHRNNCLGNKFAFIRGEDTASEGPDFVRAFPDSDRNSVNDWYVDSIGTGKYFNDMTGGTQSSVFGNKILIHHTFVNPGTSATVNAYERAGPLGGLPMAGQYVLEWVRVAKSTGGSGGPITVQVDVGGGSAGAGTPSLICQIPANELNAMALPLATEKDPVAGINFPLFLTLTTGSGYSATEDVQVTICVSLFDM